MARLAINGFGRIGRCVLRALLKTGAPLELVAVNDVDKPEALAHLFKYDSVHGTWPGEVAHGERSIRVDGREIEVLAVKEPADLPWAARRVDLVLECTGRFTDREQAQKHISAGAKKVLISAPAKGQDFTIAYGINHQAYDPARHQVVSNASCTTNCVAPLARVLLDHFGIAKGLMTTVHSYTNDQRILDLPHKDLRRSRAAALSMIPTTTGAARAVGEVIPELKGKLHGLSVRVPTPNVSLVDLTVQVGRAVTAAEVNEAFRSAAAAPLKGILRYEEALTVSCDYNGDPHSAIFDAPDTQVIGGDLVKVMAWYDNEWGFANRMVDVARLMAGGL